MHFWIHFCICHYDSSVYNYYLKHSCDIVPHTTYLYVSIWYRVWGTRAIKHCVLGFSRFSCNEETNAFLSYCYSMVYNYLFSWLLAYFWIRPNKILIYKGKWNIHYTVARRGVWIYTRRAPQIHRGFSVMYLFYDCKKYIWTAKKWVWSAKSEYGLQKWIKISDSHFDIRKKWVGSDLLGMNQWACRFYGSHGIMWHTVQKSQKIPSKLVYFTLYWSILPRPQGTSLLPNTFNKISPFLQIVSPNDIF